MFTNYIASLFYALIGNSELALRHEMIAKMTWVLDRQQAITDLFTGSLVCGAAVFGVVFIGSKINSKLQVA
ncbi:hypothetical protein PP425_gp101 [Enterobacter phage vB_EclM_Q7622]|uniref:hypothetical protein n=1 Tax=Enterobacter phage vB_EclM_Q7622 TaxID=2908628 RepID=UPI00232914DF|nr:hypothetical protein PP425_gp101 [Enterobacter phage vB_EclM_Q7622]UIS65616.1 hypothetical protein Q76222_00101 [Enterobacter phage vB_EclM_Q7622]